MDAPKLSRNLIDYIHFLADVYDRESNGWWTSGWKKTDQIGLQIEMEKEWNCMSDL